MRHKKYMDISRIKFGDEIEPANTGAFEVGDIIQITEKWDGSNGSIRYDSEIGKLVAFSRKYELSSSKSLSGFWNFVQSLDPEDYKDTPDYLIFGEWGVRNAVVYSEEAYGKWYVYDIYDMEKEKYLLQTEVKKFVQEHGLTYIHVLYEGEFISWEHCLSFCNSPAYGDKQEGIVIKNQSKMTENNQHSPIVLKYVNEGFSEIDKDKAEKIKHEQDKEKIKQKEQATRIVDMIVTENRVEKELYKMRDEGIIPEKILLRDMNIVAKYLPKRIHEDCVKEERESVERAGEYFEKTCNAKVMKIVREILLKEKNGI